MLQKLKSETSLALGSGCLGLAAVLVFLGLPRLTDTQRYYMEPGVQQRPTVGWFSKTGDVYDLALQTNQTASAYFDHRSRTLTGMNFNNNRALCIFVETTQGAESLSVEVWAQQPYPGYPLCWYDQQPFRVTVTNTGPPQVVRLMPKYPPVGRSVELIGTNAICDDCEKVPRFDEVADYNRIQNQGWISLAGAASLFASGGMILGGLTLAPCHWIFVRRSSTPLPYQTCPKPQTRIRSGQKNWRNV